MNESDLDELVSIEHEVALERVAALIKCHKLTPEEVLTVSSRSRSQPSKFVASPKSRPFDPFFDT